MRLVVIESPFRGIGHSWLHRRVDRYENVRYARACLRDSLMRGEAPFASHLLYPQVLNDDKFPERTRGLLAAMSWVMTCHLLAVYGDRGLSHGMNVAIDRATRTGVPIEYRNLGDKWRR